MKMTRKRALAGALAAMMTVTIAVSAYLFPAYATEEILPTTPGSTLRSGVTYIVNNSQTIQASGGTNGLNVPVNANVTIELRNGATLTVIGGRGDSGTSSSGNNGPGSGGAGGGAGIYLPASSTLMIQGNGVVNAYGGSGGHAGNGRGGWDGGSNAGSQGGPSGSGGGGAGSGGAGIGSRGANGGTGGDMEWSEKDDGNSGSSGSSASGSAGTLYVLDTVQLYAQGGASGGSGSGGGAGSRVKSGDYCGGGSGGGGGGAAGQSAGIGGAGGGGGGGGSGATTATFSTVSEKRGATADPSSGDSGSSGGSGGKGGGSFFKLVGSWGKKEDHWRTGGSGGGGGGGSQGGTLYCSSTATVNASSGGSGGMDGRSSSRMTLYDVQITTNLNKQPYEGRSLSLYQNGVFKAGLTAKGAFHTAYLFNPGVYSIYVDGSDTGYTLNTADSSTLIRTLNYYDTSIKLTMEDAPWEDQSVVLRKGGVTKYIMTSQTPDADGNNYFTAAVLDNDYYDVVINNTYTAGKVKAGQQFDREYFEVKLDITRDGGKWSDPTVSLKQVGGGASYTMQYQDGYYYWPIVLKGTYEINVKGYYSGPTGNITDQGNTGVTGVRLTTTPNQLVDSAIDYYTVTFYDGSTQLANLPASGMYAQQRVVQGGKATENPGAYNKGVGFTFDGWRTMPDSGILDDGPLFFGDSLSEGSTVITATTDVYAYLPPPPSPLGIIQSRARPPARHTSSQTCA